MEETEKERERERRAKKGRCVKELFRADQKMKEKPKKASEESRYGQRDEHGGLFQRRRKSSRRSRSSQSPRRRRSPSKSPRRRSRSSQSPRRRRSPSKSPRRRRSPSKSKSPRKRRSRSKSPRRRRSPRKSPSRRRKVEVQEAKVKGRDGDSSHTMQKMKHKDKIIEEAHRKPKRNRSTSRISSRSASRSRSPSPLHQSFVFPQRKGQGAGFPQVWYAREYHPFQNGSIDGTDVTPHDQALVRAVQAKYDAKHDPNIQGDPYCTLFVARLNYETSEETLRSHFEIFGPIKRMRLVRDRVTQKSRGYAFIEFEREQDFRRAYYRGHRMVIDSATVLVEFERERVMKGWKPRRLGGGLGGRKESGQLRFGGRDRPFKMPLHPDQLLQAQLYHEELATQLDPTKPETNKPK